MNSNAPASRSTWGLDKKRLIFYFTEWEHLCLFLMGPKWCPVFFKTYSMYVAVNSSSRSILDLLYHHHGWYVWKSHQRVDCYKHWLRETALFRSSEWHQSSLAKDISFPSPLGLHISTQKANNKTHWRPLSFGAMPGANLFFIEI